MNDESEFCRAIEAYLCRKNDGHLVRIVGPAFEQVCGWAGRGIPLKIACHGIDRYFERYYAKGARRRPVRVEFCEADVLDVFDEWRRAVGVPLANPAEGPAGHDSADQGHANQDNASQDNASQDSAASRRHRSLPAHLERVIARLTALRSGNDAGLDDVVDPLVRELDSARAGAQTLRGAAREAFLDRLRVLDTGLLEAVRGRSDALTLQRLGADADAELAAFRERMPPDAYAQARAACTDRLIREHARLPTIVYQ